MPNIISCLILFFFVIFILSPNTYRDIVDAAHLKPLSRHDKMNSQTNKSRWNSQIWIMFVFSHATVFFLWLYKLVGSVKKQINYQWSDNVPSSHFCQPCLVSHFYSFVNLLGYFVVSISCEGIINWQIN